VLRAADQWAAEPATVDDVLEAQDWARARAQSALSSAAQEVVPTP
jgi:1-deoxy-D-xylulose-5-phosphate reductoisomerase